MVIYKFEGASEHRVMICPHGNSMSTGPFYRTMKSVTTKLKRELETQSPREAVCKAFTARGGVMGAKSAGELPQRVYNIKHQLKKQGTSCPASKGKGRDLLFVVMEQCKSAEKKERFVQEVTCAPEPMAVLPQISSWKTWNVFVAIHPVFQSWVLIQLLILEILVLLQ